MSGPDAHASAYCLPAHIYACVVDGGGVVIDLHTNCYTGLDARGITALLHHCPGARAQPLMQLEPDAMQTLAQQLLRAGFLEEALPAHRDFDPTCIDLHAPLHGLSDLESVDRRLRPSDPVQLLRHCVRTHRRLKTSSLYALACALRQRKAALAESPAPLQDIVSLAARFARLRPYTFVAHDRCLFHSLALASFLLAHELSCTWVIGVRTRPWAAHSWVQCQDWLLNASPEEVREYVPLLAV
jgi:hypothetical protein